MWEGTSQVYRSIREFNHKAKIETVEQLKGGGEWRWEEEEVGGGGQVFPNPIVQVGQLMFKKRRGRGSIFISAYLLISKRAEGGGVLNID